MHDTSAPPLGFFFFFSRFSVCAGENDVEMETRRERKKFVIKVFVSDFTKLLPFDALYPIDYQ